MKLIIYFVFLVSWQLQAMANDVILFESPPTTKEILESFGEPVIKTRGDKKTRKIVSKNSTPQLNINETTTKNLQPTITDKNINNASAINKKEKNKTTLASHKSEKKTNTASVAFPLIFSPGSYVLSDSAIKYIDTMAYALKQKPELSIRISGHTDISGGDEVNVPLSLKRAEAVQNYLKDKHQIDLSRLEISGEGSMFLFDSKNPTSALNRRVQFERILNPN